jgi:putative intracellular protease/amidase
MKILMVLTSHDRLGETGRKTGFWLEEFAAPYYVITDAGADVTLWADGSPVNPTIWEDWLMVVRISGPAVTKP